MRLHRVHRPGDGPRGASETSVLPRSASLQPLPCPSVQTLAFTWWHSFARAEPSAVTPRSRAAACAPGAKGLTARTSAAEPSALRSCEGRLSLGPPERGTVDPHAM